MRRHWNDQEFFFIQLLRDRKKNIQRLVKGNGYCSSSTWASGIICCRRNKRKKVKIEKSYGIWGREDGVITEFWPARSSGYHWHLRKACTRYACASSRNVRIHNTGKSTHKRLLWQFWKVDGYVAIKAVISFRTVRLWSIDISIVLAPPKRTWTALFCIIQSFYIFL